MLSKEVSSTIFKVFGMTRPGIEPQSLGLVVNTLPTRPMVRLNNNNNDNNNKKKKKKKKDKYRDLARELKTLWNMKVTIVPIVIGAFGTISKGLLNGLEDVEVGGWVETIQMTALLRTARILRRILET